MDTGLSMADAEKAIAFVLSNEGGFVDNSSDSGGATNFGLSLRFLRQIPTERLKRYGIFTLPEHLSVADIRELRPEQAELIYKCEFWDNVRYHEITSDGIATYIFDMAVLHGESQAIKITQRAAWAMSFSANYLIDDGILGDKTISYLNDLTIEGRYTFLRLLMAERAGFMRLICVENPRNREFLDGWLNRCYRI